MEMAVRAELEEVQSSKEEKEPKLKCHEMRLIFQRLPTSELIRFVSNQPKHPLGKLWSQELKFVIENRLPFSLKAKTTARGLASDHVIFDCNGSRVAEIKRAQHFHLSPICELIESAELPAIPPIFSGLRPAFMFPIPDILSTLTNLDTLVLSICRRLRDPVDRPVVLSPEVMSLIKSLTLADLYCYGQLWKPLLEVISRATGLKKLSVSYVEQNAISLFATLPSVRVDYSCLESLSVKLLHFQSVQPLLELITSRFNGLRELVMPVRAPIRHYLAAFQGLSSLATLGLDAYEFIGYEKAEKQWAVDENVAPIVSVTELRIACWSFNGKESRIFLAMLSKFPNLRILCAHFRRDMTDFTSAVCAGGVFRQLQSVKLFCCTPLTHDALLQFIRANIDHLPSSIDLSHILTARPRNLDRDFLVDLCTTLQTGRVTSLAFKDLVHRDAVRCLREHFALTQQDKFTPQAEAGKILAWIDEGAIEERRIQSMAPGWPLEVSDFTDFRIEARKTSGPLKGSSFKVRISDWTEKRERLFEA